MAKEYDFSGKYFEAQAVSQGELEALKRFPEYEALNDGTLMRIEGSKEFRIYLENGAEGLPFNVMTPGLLREIQESYHRKMEEIHGPLSSAADGVSPPSFARTASGESTATEAANASAHTHTHPGDNASETPIPPGTLQGSLCKSLAISGDE